MINEFLDMMAGVRGASDNTIISYSHDLNEIDDFIKSPISKATIADLENYIKDCTKRGLSAKTQARRVSSLRRYFRFLILEGVRKDNPAKSIDLPKTEKSLPKELSQNEINTLLENCNSKPDGIRMRAMIELLYASGLRISELLSLKLTSIINEKTALHITGKGNKDRVVPFHETAQNALSEYLKVRELFIKKSKKSDFLFPSKKGTLIYSRSAFSKAIKKHAVVSGVSPSKISAHAFRHSFASHLLRNGADLRSVQMLLGHEDLSTTEIYTNIMDDEMKEAVFKNHPLAKLD